MRTIPGMTVINPSDGVSAQKLIEQAVAMEGPCYIRLGRASVPVTYKEEDSRSNSLNPNPPRAISAGDNYCVLFSGFFDY